MREERQPTPQTGEGVDPNRHEGSDNQNEKEKDKGPVAAAECASNSDRGSLGQGTTEETPTTSEMGKHLLALPTPPDSPRYIPFPGLPVEIWLPHTSSRL